MTTLGRPDARPSEHTGNGRPLSTSERSVDDTTAHRLAAHGLHKVSQYGMMNFALTTTNGVLKTRNCVLTTRKCEFKMMNFAALSATRSVECTCSASVTPQSRTTGRRATSAALTTRSSWRRWWDTPANRSQRAGRVGFCKKMKILQQKIKILSAEK